MTKTFNWSEVRKAVVNDIRSVSKKEMKGLVDEVSNKLKSSGFNGQIRSIPVSGKLVSKIVEFKTENEDEYEDGKIYFEKVYNDMKGT